MTGAARRLVHRVGRRGAALLFFALIDLVSAFSYAWPTAEARRTAILAYAAHLAPLGVWAALWGIAGVTCLVGAFLRRDRVPFAVAMAIKVLWAVVTMAGWLFGGVERGYVSAAVWLGLAGWVAIISGWPEERQIGP